MRKLPKNLNLFTIQFPIIAKCSILHRITGALLFFLLPVFICLLDYSLSAQANFTKLFQFMQTMPGKLLLFLIFLIINYHLVMGVRHILIDFHLFEAKTASIISTYIALIIYIILMILTGMALC